MAMRYEHTQTAPLHLILVVVSLGMFVGAWLTPVQVVQVLLLASGALMFLLASCFRQLTVSDEGDRLMISFGPIPLFRRYVPFSDIETVQQARSTILDGWGIHLSPSGGWIWNLWGFDCVDVWYSKDRKFKKLRIGTDDPVGLEAFLRDRVEE